MSKSAVADSDAEWIWETYAAMAASAALAWLAEQLDHISHRQRTAQLLLQRAVEDDAWPALELRANPAGFYDRDTRAEERRPRTCAFEHTPRLVGNWHENQHPAQVGAAARVLHGAQS